MHLLIVFGNTVRKIRTGTAIVSSLSETPEHRARSAALRRRETCGKSTRAGSASPALDEQTDEILGELGFGAEQIAGYRGHGVVR
ncbi:MAG: hypothetical protein ACYDCQ_01565 [Dehalococcoidia bacterium]